MPTSRASARADFQASTSLADPEDSAVPEVPEAINPRLPRAAYPVAAGEDAEDLVVPVVPVWAAPAEGVTDAAGAEHSPEAVDPEAAVETLRAAGDVAGAEAVPVDAEAEAGCPIRP